MPKIKGCLAKVLRNKSTVIIRAVFWKIPHNSDQEDTCAECGVLLQCANERIDVCSYTAASKPVCGWCKSNCFAPEMHRMFSQIMKYAEPHMVYAIRSLLWGMYEMLSGGG